MNLTYKKLSEDDWKTTTAIESASADGKIFKAYTDEKDAREFLRKSTVYLILLGNTPIGTVSYERKSKDHAYIDTLIILPEYRGHGYASEAFGWLLGQLKEYTKVDLVTHPHNSKALSIYLKYGFVIESWKDNYFGDGEPRLVLVRKHTVT
jgi:ribosomal protein S18 acetylase RimI-like enzyme